MGPRSLHDTRVAFAGEGPPPAASCGLVARLAAFPRNGCCRPPVTPDSGYPLGVESLYGASSRTTERRLFPDIQVTAFRLAARCQAGFTGP